MVWFLSMVWANLHFLIALGSKKIFLCLTPEFYPEWKEEGEMGGRGLMFLRGETGTGGTALKGRSGRSTGCFTSGIRGASSDTKMPCRKCSSGLVACFYPQYLPWHNTIFSCCQLISPSLFPEHRGYQYFYYLSSYCIHMLDKTLNLVILKLHFFPIISKAG